MARIIHDDQGGSNSAEGHLTVIQADGQTHMQLPEGDFMSKGDILRDGQDLVLQSSDGQQIVVEGYFSAMPAPTLTTPQGSTLTPELVESFVKSSGPVEMAANGTENDASPVGIIKELSGDATVTRADGTSEKATLGMDIHQGDIIETSAEGAVNIVFLDESTFAISNNARMAIDEYVFDPATQAGETNVSILRGMFVFTSGLIGRDDPDDVTIDTPVGSIGIRGTTIAGNIQPDGQSQITVVEGAIVIKNGSGEMTLANQYETVNLTGFDAPIQMAGTLDANQMKDSYGMMGTVNAGFFNTLNTEPADNAPEEGVVDDVITGEDPASEATPAEAPTETAPLEVKPLGTAPLDSATEPTTEPLIDPAKDPITEGQLATEQPVLTSYNTFSDPLNTGFDTSVAPKSGDPYAATGTTSITGTTLTGTAILGPMPPPPPPGSTPTTTAGNTIPMMPPPGTTALPPLELRVEVFIDDDALAGDVVGRAFTTLAFPDVQMQFLNVPLDGGTPMFSLVAETAGVYRIVLTAAGANAILSATLNSVLGNVAILARLPDGRETISTAPANYGDYDTVAGPLPPLNLNTLGGTVLNNGGGYSAAYLGDYDHNGTNNFAVTTETLTGSVFIDGLAPFTKGGDSADMEIAGGGDFNGDGNLDFVTGRAYFDGGFTDNGQVNVHSGAAPATASNSNGGGNADLFGSSVAMIDFNGDGFADVFAGARGAGGGAGQVSFLTGFDSFSFTGGTFTSLATGGGGAQLGLSMTGLSDYNGDGFGDLAVGGNGFVRLYMGSAAVTGGATYTIAAAIDGTSNMPVYDLGDVNGDGRSDLMIMATGYNANAGAALISFGNAGGAAVNLTIRAGAGEKVVGGGSVGDFNGDGFDDMFVATRNGNMVDGYVIYGGTGLAGTITLNPTWMASNPGAGFHMTLNLNGHLADPVNDSIELTATSIGDQSGGGFEDMVISSAQFNNGNGGYYVVYGQADQFDLAGPDPEVHAVGVNAPALGAIASSAGDGLVGSTGNDTLSDNNAGNIYSYVSFRSGAGNDTLLVHSATPRVLDGGLGFDTASFYAGNVDLRSISELSGVERFLMDGAAQTMTIGLNDIFSLMESSNDLFDADGAGGMTARYTLRFDENADGAAETLNIDNSGAGTTMASAGLAYMGNSGGYNVYNHGSGYQVLIDQDITVNVV